MSIRPVLGSRAAIGGPLGSGRGGAGNGLLTGLVAYWGLDEASGNALDKHSGGLTLTQANSPGATTGLVYATARTLDGSNQYFSRNSETALQTGNINFALAIWVKILAKKNFGMIFTKSYPSEYELRMSSDGTKFEWIVNAGSQIFGTTTIGAWQLLIVGYSTATASQFYSINGGAVTESATTAATVNTQAVRVGRRSDGFYGNIQIGPVAFWKNRTLSADDRTLLWNGGAGLAYSAFTA